MATTQANRPRADPTLPARLRAFHERLPLAGDRGTLPDDQVLYLAAILRDTPVPAPALSPEAWQGFRDVLRPHGVYPLLAYRLRAWPEKCRPPLEVMDYLNRLFLDAAARSMKAGRACQQHHTPQGRLFIEPRGQGRLAGSTRPIEVLHTRPSVERTVQ